MSNQKMKTLQAYLPEELFKKVEDAANREYRSVSRQATMILEQYFERQEAQENKPDVQVLQS